MFKILKITLLENCWIITKISDKKSVIIDNQISDKKIHSLIWL